MSTFQVSEVSMDPATVLVCRGRLDHAGARVLEEQAEALLKRGVRAVILDVAEVDYLSSAGLRSVLVILKKISLAQGTLRLCGATAEVLQVLELSGFVGILKTYPDRHAAMHAK